MLVVMSGAFLEYRDARSNFILLEETKMHECRQGHSVRQKARAAVRAAPGENNGNRIRAEMIF